jgi:hypothetical protein
LRHDPIKHRIRRILLRSRTKNLGGDGVARKRDVAQDLDNCHADVECVQIWCLSVSGEFLEGKRMQSKAIGIAVLGAALALCGPISLAQAPQVSLPERVAALKANLAASQANLRHYEWIETIIVSLNGEEKSRKQQRCYYGADGALQKVVVDASPPPATKPGLRGRIIANKTAELTAYMQSAVSLVKSYVPPDPAKIQAAKDTGKVSIDVLVPGQSARINFRDYQIPGDTLSVAIDIASNRVAGVTVASYLDSPTDVVTMDAHLGQLDDGTSYTSDITLNAPTKKLTVTVQNTGYRKTS